MSSRNRLTLLCIVMLTGVGSSHGLTKEDCIRFKGDAFFDCMDRNNAETLRQDRAREARRSAEIERRRAAQRRQLAEEREQEEREEKRSRADERKKQKQSNPDHASDLSKTRLAVAQGAEIA